MAYTLKQIEDKFNEIITLIESGKSLRQSTESINVNYKTFYEWIDNDEDKSKRYARACETRADKLADEILHIADDSTNDTKVIDKGGNSIEIENTEWVNRSKLRVDSRKWLLSKLAPKKYGDKLDVTTDGDKLPTQFNLIIHEVKKEDES
jgi:hypothetical protein